MENTNSEICSPIDPEKRLREVQSGLCELFKRSLSDKELAEMVKPWGNYVRGYNKAKIIDVESEREQLDRIIAKLIIGCDALNELKRFDMQRFNPQYELSGKLTKQDDAILLIEEQLRLANETRACTLQENNASINQQRLELLAMISLFVHAEKKYGLKALDKVGRGNKNPVLEFVRIVSNIKDNERISRHYKKYKEWKKNPETLP